MKSKDFIQGIKAGIPVCIGYFSVSFGFGSMAVAQGLSIFQAVLISASNLTSAGQFAGRRGRRKPSSFCIVGRGFLQQDKKGLKKYRKCKKSYGLSFLRML